MYDNIQDNFEYDSKWPFTKLLNDSKEVYRVYFYIIPFFVSFLLIALKGTMHPNFEIVLERPRQLNFLRFHVAFGLSVTDLLLTVMTITYSILLVWARMKRSMAQGAKKLTFLFQDSDTPIERFSWEWTEILAKTLGVLAIVLLGWFVLMPMGRKSVLLEVLHVPREVALKYHRWLGWFTLGVCLTHVVLFLSIWVYANGNPIYDPDSNLLRQMMVPGSCKDESCDADTNTYHVQNMYGYATAIAMIFMCITSWDFIRRKYYEVFYYSHQVYWLLTLFLCFHYRGTLLYLIPGIAIIVIDKTIGYISTFFAVQAQATLLSQDWFEIKVRKEKSFRCEAGQYVFINVPMVSVIEWHPMTVTWETEDQLVLHIKAHGNDSWTQRVIEEVRASGGYFPVRLDGFYGSNHIVTGALDHKDAVVFFCGGIGLTFPMSIIMELCALHPELPVYLNWVTRTKEEYVAFEKLLLATEKMFSNLSVSVWITLKEQQSSPDTEEEPPRFGSASTPKSSNRIAEADGDDAPTNLWHGHATWMFSPSTHALVNAVAIILATTGFSIARSNEGSPTSPEPRYLLGSQFVELVLSILLVVLFVYLVVGIRLGYSMWKNRSKKRNGSMKQIKSRSKKFNHADSDIKIETSPIIIGVGQRPDIAKVIEKIQSDCHSSANVAVNACGPLEMVNIVKDECQKRVWSNWTMYQEEWEW
jgi:predicted ferric reductase